MVDIRQGELHVWSATQARILKYADLSRVYFSEEERKKAASLGSVAVRDAGMAARLYTRIILSAYLSCDPAEVLLTENEYGKPLISNDLSSDLFYNISHSGGRILLGIAYRASVGVDIERVRSDLPYLNLARRFFARSEYNLIVNAPESDKVNMFFRIWTKKEAFVKAQGRGIAYGLKQFVVDPVNKGMDCLRLVFRCI